MQYIPPCFSTFYHEQWFIVGTKKVMGVNHEVNSPKINENFSRWQWLGKTDPKQAFILTQNAFKKLLWDFWKII